METSTYVELLKIALTPCEHRSDAPCAGCEMIRRQERIRAIIANHSKQIKLR